MTAPAALAACMPSMMSSAVVVGKRGKNAAAVEPAHAPAKNRFPVEIARLELRRGFVAAIVKHDRRAHALAAVAVDGRHVRTAERRRA